MDWVELARSVHGHIGVLAAIALVHPVIFLRPNRPLSRGQRWSVAGAGALFAVAMGMGLALYPHFRETERPRLLAHDFAVAMWFERKEHLVYIAACLVFGGVGTVFLARNGEHNGRARLMFGLAAGICLFAASVGTTVGAWIG